MDSWSNRWLKKAADVEAEEDGSLLPQALEGAMAAYEEGDEAMRKLEYEYEKGQNDGQWEIRQAVVFIRDSQQGRSRAANLSGRTYMIYHAYHSKYYRMAYAVVVILLLGLAEFEEPSTFHHFRSKAVEHKWELTALFELLLMWFIFADVHLKRQMLGMKIFRRNPFNWLKAFVVTFSVLNILITLLVSAVTGGQDRFPRFQRVLRPLLLITHFRNVQKVFLAMMRAMKNICRVGVLLLLEICFFSIFAFVFFKNTSFSSYDVDADGRRFGNDAMCGTSDEQTSVLGCSTYSQDCTDYFHTLFEAINKLFIVTTTANFPDVMLPVYQCR
jgi:hypothetical protein